MEFKIITQVIGKKKLNLEMNVLLKLGTLGIKEIDKFTKLEYLLATKTCFSMAYFLPICNINIM